MQKLYENKTHTTKLVKIENKKGFSLKKENKKGTRFEETLSFKKSNKNRKYKSLAKKI